MAIWRLYPVVAPSDSAWLGRPIWEEVIVRADTAGMARVVASKLEYPKREGGVGNESHSFNSGLDNERLYWIKKLSAEEAARFDDSPGNPAVLSATPLGSESEHA
ncbi:hypothetical protein ACFOW6_17245 [Fodinicurvata halophila]|uniref:Uncharacterized protein n=1 Tax=Fodinicurvata halophila TaxID=1419723 RepID=A0ABV8UPV0_9PROT